MRRDRLFLPCPLEWRCWMRLGAAGAGAAAVGAATSTPTPVHAETSISRRASEHHRRRRPVRRRRQTSSPLSAGRYMSGLRSKTGGSRETSLLAGSAIVLSGTTSTVTEVVVGRARPYTGGGAQAFEAVLLHRGRLRVVPFGAHDHHVRFLGVLAERMRNTGRPSGCTASPRRAESPACTRTSAGCRMFSSARSSRPSVSRSLGPVDSEFGGVNSGGATQCRRSPNRHTGLDV